MNYFKITVRTLFYLAASACIVVFGALIYLDGCILDSYRINEGDKLSIDSALPISISYDRAVADDQRAGNRYTAQVKVFGFIPARNITVDVVEEKYVYVLGTPFGIKIYTDGVLVVGFSDVETAEGKRNPAASAGIREGDFIVSINGTNVYTNEDVLSLIKESMGGDITAKIVRNGARKTVKFRAVLSTDGVYRAGMWVKDSSAGIGTLTFYSPSSQVVSGLGHGISDNDTGTLLSLNHGEFVPAEIVSIEKGKNGSPGELKGRFKSGSISSFSLNSHQGVYGITNGNIEGGQLMQVALKQEIKNGAAYILTTIDGGTPQYYSCKIEVRGMGQTQNLLVTVTDRRLLEKTGGIVQGMSGSPIIQNDKLVGAVTHVLIENSKCGYGIFAETMLDNARNLTKSALKKAS